MSSPCAAPDDLLAGAAAAAPPLRYVVRSCFARRASRDETGTLPFVRPPR